MRAGFASHVQTDINTKKINMLRAFPQSSALSLCHRFVVFFLPMCVICPVFRYGDALSLHQSGFASLANDEVKSCFTGSFCVYFNCKLKNMRSDVIFADLFPQGFCANSYVKASKTVVFSDAQPIRNLIIDIRLVHHFACLIPNLRLRNATLCASK